MYERGIACTVQSDRFLQCLKPCLRCVQTLLRGVVPNSFPSRLSFDPAMPGERRFVVMDSNVYKLYGHLVQQVQAPFHKQRGVLWCCQCCCCLLRTCSEGCWKPLHVHCRRCEWLSCIS